LVRTAAELFWSQGYAQTGVSSIMKHARATSGSFYHFFPTKDDLLVAVFDAVGGQLEAEILDEAETASDDPIRRLSLVVDAYRERTAPNAAGFGIPVGRLVGELGSGHAAARLRLEKILQAFAARIDGWLDEIADGRSRAIDRWRVAVFVVSALEGAAVLASARGNTEPFDACETQLQYHIDSLIGASSDRTEEIPPPAPSDEVAVDWKSW